MQSILYQSAEQDITLVDIPASIAVAMGTNDVLLSSKPPIQPYPSNNPKTVAGKAKLVAQHAFDDELHSVYSALIEKALTNIRLHVTGDWCLPRKLMSQVPKPRQSSDMELDDPELIFSGHLKMLSEDDQDLEDLTLKIPSLSLSSQSQIHGSDTTAWTATCVSEDPFQNRDSATSSNDLDVDSTATEHSEHYPWTRSFHNTKDYPLTLTVSSISSSSSSSSGQDSTSLRFKIPSLSSFFLYDCHNADLLRSAFRDITQEHNLPRHFNFILLDPPWPNRSARRKGAYATQSTTSDLKKMILRMDLDSYIEHDGLVGIWVTNKPALRTLVLGPNGIFERLNVGLVEEWIWIKCTVSGEPVSAMESLWRKPYEVLLLGKAAPNSWTVAQPAEEVKRRVIAGVPDLHSRKPCLKQVIEPFMPDIKDYSALEIFSRHLVSGWCSWGNEVLRFNSSQYWDNSQSDAQPDLQHGIQIRG